MGGGGLLKGSPREGALAEAPASPQAGGRRAPAGAPDSAGVRERCSRSQQGGYLWVCGVCGSAQGNHSEV